MKIENSSFLAEATYDPETKELVVTETNGNVWPYMNVSSAIWEKWQKTFGDDLASGRFFHNTVDRYELKPKESK